MGIVGLVVGGVSVSLRGIAGWFVMTKGPLHAAPRSGFFPLRYRVYQLRSTLRFMRLVIRLICRAPVALLLGRTRNGSRSTGSSPLDFKKAVRKAAWLSSSSVLSVMYWGMSPSRF